MYDENKNNSQNETRELTEEDEADESLEYEDTTSENIKKQNDEEVRFIQTCAKWRNNNDWVQFYNWTTVNRPIENRCEWNNVFCLNDLVFGLSQYKKSLPNKRKRNKEQNEHLEQTNHAIQLFSKRALEIDPGNRIAKIGLAYYHYDEYINIDTKYNRQDYELALNIYSEFEFCNARNFVVNWRYIHLQQIYLEHSDGKRNFDTWVKILFKIGDLISFYNVVDNELRKKYRGTVNLCKLNYAKIVTKWLLKKTLRNLVNKNYGKQYDDYPDEMNKWFALSNQYLSELENEYPVSEYVKSVHTKRGITPIIVQYRKALLYLKVYEFIYLKGKTATKYLTQAETIFENVIQIASKMQQRRIGFAFPWYAYAPFGETLFLLGKKEDAIKVLLSVPQQFQGYYLQSITTLKQLFLLTDNYLELIGSEKRNPHAVAKFQLTENMKEEIRNIGKTSERDAIFYQKIFNGTEVGLAELSDYLTAVFQQAVKEEQSTKEQQATIAISKIRQFMQKNIHYLPEYDSQLPKDERIYAAYVHLKNHCFDQRDAFKWRQLQKREFQLNVFEKEILQDLKSGATD